MMSRSGGLKPRAVAGRPSVTKLTQSSWTGIRASGRPKAAVRKILYPKVQCHISNNAAVNTEAGWDLIPCWGFRILISTSRRAMGLNHRVPEALSLCV